MIEHGNMVIVLGDEEAKAWFGSGRERVDDWLYELVDSIVFQGAEALRLHAPGRIKELVGVSLPHEPDLGSFEGIAGVEPDFSEEVFGRGLGSDPADYPVFVDQGTGIFGEFKSPIYTIPGHVMGPIEYRGRTKYVPWYRGQPGQHYSEKAFEDTVAWVPGHIELAKAELYAKTAPL